MLQIKKSEIETSLILLANCVMLYTGEKKNNLPSTACSDQLMPGSIKFDYLILAFKKYCSVFPPLSVGAGLVLSSLDEGLHTIPPVVRGFSF